MAKAKAFQFEKALETLNETVEQLEQGDLSLEDSLKAFEKGVKLTRECQQALKQAEQKVQILLKDQDTLSNFEEGEDE